ncbi:phosphoribosylaminoimidazolesuccinocarboxamide synthase [Enterococcus nangangensis]|uniref:phosphoribosylaminoimidazolesuccinocarboxamide synthase n=1 Tax=Enterococcus nangangensis TaxID=2559926 RepID=UPI0010F9FA84|nr:phosphoribosylaminoimidazolesuccinocarboxamide synthase [Enterococcus nangangensis]
MEKLALQYQGKAKKLYATEDPNVLWVEYLNQATALNGLKKDEIKGKGILNNAITSLIFQELSAAGIASHFIEKISESEQLVQKVTIVPLEVVVRNYAAGSFTKRLGLAEGTKLAQPIVEFYYKNDDLADPLINDDTVLALNLATATEIATIKDAARQVNEVLIALFHHLKIRLIDFKIEFGRDTTGAILLADEISPDTCRLWDETTNEHLDKDIYRRDLGELVPVYQEVLRRLENNQEEKTCIL